MRLSTTCTGCLLAMMLPMGCWSQSLQEAVLMALDHYPSLASARFKTEAAQSDIVRAKGAHWPQLSWSGTNYDYRNDSIPNRWVPTPVLSLNLWSGGRIQSDVERAEALTQSSQKQELVTRDDVALLISEGYLAWAHQKQMVVLARDNLDAHEKILRDFQTISQIDTGRRIDLDQAQVRYDNARLFLIRSETDMRVAAERVTRMLSAPLPAEPSGLEACPATAHTSLAQAQAELNDRHPEIARLLAQREAAQASVRYAQAQSAPTVNLSHSKLIAPGTTQSPYVTQLQLNLPIIDGGTARGAVGVATANLQALEADLAETRLTLNEQLSAAWTSWRLSRQRADMGQEQTRTAQKLAQSYEQQFRAGRRSLLDLLNIQSDLYSYKSNAATALHESRLAQVRILANLGQLASAYTAAPAPTPEPPSRLTDSTQPDAALTQPVAAAFETDQPPLPTDTE